MSNNVLNIKLAAKDSPTVYISINEAGSVSGTGSVSPVIKFVASGEAGPQGAQGPQGTIEGTDVISTTNIQNSAVTTIKLDDDSVTNDKLAPNSVYGNAIQDYSIVNSKLGPDAVTSDKIQDNAITSDHIAPNAINEELIESGIITSASIASKTISSAEIQNGTLVKENFQLGTIDGTVIVNNLTLTGILTTNGYKNLGQSPGVYEGPDDEDMHLKYHQGLDFVNTDGTVVASFDQTGNFSLSGTVDGIDIATDVAANTLKNTYPTADATKVGYLTVTQSLNLDSMKTKLDGIEDNATGDQTAAEIRALVDLAYDSEVFTDADHAKLDGIEAGATADQTAEEIQDIVGPFIATGGTKTGIAITYDDANNDMDFVVDHDAATNFVAEEHYRWDNDIQSTATINHANLSSDTSSEGEVLVINDGDAVWGHPEKIHLQVRNDEGATIPAGAPLYSKGEIGGSNRILVGICDADDSAKMPCIGLAEAEMNTTDTKDNFAITQGVYNTNISGFTGLAVGDTLYVDTSGSAPHLTKTKPTGESSLIQNVGIVLKTNGSICQGLQVSAIGRTNDVPNLDQNALFIGNASNQAVATDAPMVGVITAADAGAARTVLGVDAAGTDNSTNVTLAGTPDYITISGQEITRNAIDLTADVSGTLPVANGGTGQTDLSNVSVGTAAALTSGDKTVDGNLTVNGDVAIGNDAEITSVGKMTFRIDSDANEGAESFYWKDNASDLIASLSEGGLFSIFGTDLGNPKILLSQSGPTATYGPPLIEFIRQSVTVDNADIGRFDFKARDTGGSETLYAQILGLTEESGAGTEGGKIEFKIASHDGELVTALTIEDGDAEDEIDISIGSGTSSNTQVAGNLNVVAATNMNSLNTSSIVASSLCQFQSTVRFDSTIYFSTLYDTTLSRTAAGELSIGSSKIVTESHPGFQKHVLNCGWYGSYTTRQYLPFGYGGTFEASSPSGYLEYGAFIAPCNGEVESVIIRSEIACGNSTVGIHIAPNGTEMPSFNPGTGVSDTVNMSADDTSYKFENFDGQYDDDLNTFNAGDIIVVSFDPSAASQDSVATMVLNLDWTNPL